MGFDYALVHLKYTIPPPVVLTLCYRSFATKLDLYKVLFLVTIAVASTTPWDSYLIKTQIWTYPQHAIVGPKIFSIPAEEIFFFIIQTYNTTLLYLFLSKPTFHPAYIRGQKLLNDSRWIQLWGWIGIIGVIAAILAGSSLVTTGKTGLYMGLILVWAGPFILLLWQVNRCFVLDCASDGLQESCISIHH